jgi:DNA-binding response OmpR family regulator
MEMDIPSSYSEDIYVGDVTIHPESRYAESGGKDLKLTPMEFNLLLYLAKNQNKGVSREELLSQVWGFESEVDTRATDDMIKRLRKKLANTGATVKIDTLWGFGFMISK